MKIATSALLSIFALSSVFGVAGAASGGSYSESLSDLETTKEIVVGKFYDFLVENEVDLETAQYLADELSKGNLPDSASGADPIAVETGLSADSFESRAIFADGSVSVTSVGSGGTDSVRPFALDSCSITSGSGFRNFTNCNVTGGNGLTGMGFTASFTLVQGGYDQITAYYPATQNCAVSCDTPYLADAKQNEDANSGARVVYFMRSQYWIPTRTSSLGLYVGGDDYFTHWQW